MRITFLLLLTHMALACQVQPQSWALSDPYVHHDAPNDAVAKVQTLAAKWMDSLPLPSLSIAVGLNGQRIYAQAWGYADEQSKRAADPLSQYRIGSVSKSLTSLALGRLYEQGKLDLDAEVHQYVPDFPRKAHPITVRQLACHQAGIRHYQGMEFMSNVAYDDVFKPLDVFSSDKLLFEPGTDYTYSTYGWTLLSAVIEKAAGMPFLTYMQDNILTPLQIGLVPDQNDADLPHRVSFYTSRGQGRYGKTPPVDLSNKWAGGGYLGSPSDLVALGLAVAEQSLLKPETWKVLTTIQGFKDGRPTGRHYALGWRVEADAQGNRIVFHSGGSMGGRTWLVVWPELGLTVATTVNSDRGLSRQMVEQIGACFLP